MSERWFRTNVDEESTWLFGEDALVRYAWHLFKAYTASHSTGVRVRCVPVRVLAHEFRFNDGAPIARMLELACKPWKDEHGKELAPAAIAVEEGCWLFNDARPFETPDATRKREQREEEKRSRELSVLSGQDGQNGHERPSPETADSSSADGRGHLQDRTRPDTTDTSKSPPSPPGVVCSHSDPVVREAFRVIVACRKWAHHGSPPIEELVPICGDAVEWSGSVQAAMRWLSEFETLHVHAVCTGNAKDGPITLRQNLQSKRGFWAVQRKQKREADVAKSVGRDGIEHRKHPKAGLDFEARVLDMDGRYTQFEVKLDTPEKDAYMQADMFDRGAWYRARGIPESEWRDGSNRPLEEAMQG